MTYYTMGMIEPRITAVMCIHAGKSIELSIMLEWFRENVTVKLVSGVQVLLGVLLLAVFPAAVFRG